MSLQLGYGEGFSLGFVGDGDGSEVRYLAVFPGLGFGLTDVKAENAWYRGNFDLVIEGEFISNFRPRNGSSIGLSFLARYNFLRGERFIPYVEAGGGIGYLDFDLEDQEDGVIFYPQAGFGFHHFLTDRVAANVSLRLHHMSNAGTNMPNDSINAGLVLVGFTYHLD